MPSCKTKKHSNRIVINVGGVRHETFLSTLKNIPDTRLYNLGDHHTTVAKSPEYDKSTGEYFFDRHPGVFAHILNFYRTGRLHCPADVCGPLFEEELGFWSIDEQQVETCCWESYKQHKEKQEKLKYFKLPGYDDELEDRYLSKDSGLFEDVDDVQSWWSRYQPKVWKSLEEPHTSLWAKFVGMVSFLMFTAYLIKFSLTTLDYFSDRTAPRYIALSVIHLICLSWFTMDFALRLVFSPDKRAFVKSPFTWTDLIPLVLLYVFFFFPSLEKVPFLEMLVMLKAARIFQLFKLSYVLQVLVNTLKASSSELCLLLGIMAFVMVVFASIMYFLERHEFESDFKSVPESMWWAVITMTTVGYGEVYPRTWIGKTVGSACAICGVLVIALPVSVVASNFSLFYTYAKARLNVPPKKRRVALSHALTSMHNARTQGGEAQSLKFASLGSDRATPDRSLQASEISISCTMTPRGSLKKSSFWSLRSFSKLLRPQRRSYMSHSQSLNSILSEIKHNKQQESIEGITLKLEPPSRAPSAIDLPKFQGSLPTGDNPFLHVPEHKKTYGVKGSIKEPCGLPLLNKSLYPLHLRRGAVSPASFSLKSNSTASSLNALPRGYNELCNALSGKGPIILLSDQASVNSFCSLQSLNPRMACSCSSLGDTTATNDGSSVSSIPMAAAKADGRQITLSVPVERHGQRKQSKENKTEETKEKDCDYNLLATDNEKRRSETDDGIKQNEEFAPPVGLFKIMDDESPATLCNSELSLSDQEMADGIDSVFTHEESAGNLPAQFLSSALGSRQQESNIIRMNQNNSNGFCRDGSDGSSDGESAAGKESPLPKFRPSEENQFSDKDNVTLSVNPSATTCLVRPSPSFGKTSLMSCGSLESDLSNDMLPLNGEIYENVGLGTQNRTAPLAMTNNSNKNNNVAPKRRNSAFTFCRKDSSSKSPRKRSVPLSAGYMRELTAECEPLWNGHVARARPCDETLETQMDLHSNSCQGDYESRLRKSGLLSSTDSPTNSTQEIHEPLDENKRFRRNCTNSDEHENIDIQDEVDWLRPISPLSSQREPLYNSTADGFRPILSVEYEQCSKTDRTTRV